MKREIYILGNGAMATAMALGLKAKYEVIIIGRDEKKLQALKDEGFKTRLYADFDIKGKDIILGFKPYALEEVATLFKSEANFIISPLACTPIKKLKVIKAKNYAWIMPNIAASFAKSCTPYILENSFAKEEIEQILQSFGSAIRLESETQMDAAGTLAGCAPAYLSLVADALACAGVYNGLKNELARELVAASFESTAALLKSKLHPALLKDRVCSPGGTTIKGVYELENANIRGSFIKAVNASVRNKN